MSIKKAKTIAFAVAATFALTGTLSVSSNADEVKYTIKDDAIAASLTGKKGD